MFVTMRPKALQIKGKETRARAAKMPKLQWKEFSPMRFHTSIGVSSVSDRTHT